MNELRRGRAVELLNAFVFACEDCGRDTFVRGITVAPESVDVDELPDGMAEIVAGWEADGGDGSWMMAPDTVECSHCGARFDVETP